MFALTFGVVGKSGTKGVFPRDGLGDWSNKLRKAGFAPWAVERQGRFEVLPERKLDLEIGELLQFPPRARAVVIASLFTVPEIAHRLLVWETFLKPHGDYLPGYSISH